MLNQLVIVGRLTNNPELTESEERKKYTTITVAVPRNYKNPDGEFGTDFIPVILWDMIAQNTTEYLHKGDLVGIKGRIESKEKEIVVIGEKVTFLSNNKNGEE